MRVVILNPAPGGVAFTTLAKAVWYVARKRARWSDPVKRVAIQFRYEPVKAGRAREADERQWRQLRSGKSGPDVMQWVVK